MEHQIMKIYSFLLFCLLTCSATVASADKGFRIGWMPSITSTSIEDPNGPVEDHTAAALLQAVGIFDMGRDVRIFANAVYDKYEVDASTTNIHYDVSRFGINATYQWNVRLTRSFKPWLGVGLGYSQDTFADRYTLTPGGFLAASYPDRTVDSFNLVLNSSIDWQISRDLDLGIHFQWEQPTGDGARSARVGVYIAY
jgi:outer membrane protein W